MNLRTTKPRVLGFMWFKVKVLDGRAKEEAYRQGCTDDDLVVVRTFIKPGELPRYEVEKVEGSPVSFIREKLGLDDE